MPSLRGWCIVPFAGNPPVHGLLHEPGFTVKPPSPGSFFTASRWGQNPALVGNSGYPVLGQPEIGLLQRGSCPYESSIVEENKACDIDGTRRSWANGVWHW